MAALQLAKIKGAEIYATVDSDSKARHLTEQFNLPSNRVFSSRDDSFVSGIMRETNGLGVDLVLNSLPGDLLNATSKCVAEFGTMVELGTGDTIGSGKLDMSSFSGGRSYTGVHLDVLMARKQSFATE
jgi:NADPH:quinone reductase-like Zn-dependent oxidoreductase